MAPRLRGITVVVFFLYSIFYAWRITLNVQLLAFADRPQYVRVSNLRNGFPFGGVARSARSSEDIVVIPFVVAAMNIDLRPSGCSCELRCAPRFGEGVVRGTIQLGTRVRWQIAECTASRRKSFRHVCRPRHRPIKENCVDVTLPQVSKEMWTSFVISGHRLNGSSKKLGATRNDLLFRCSWVH